MSEGGIAGRKIELVIEEESSPKDMMRADYDKNRLADFCV